MGITAKTVVLLSSGQPSINPRLVKEADALSDAGYEVTVLYQYWNAWATRLDTDLLATKRWKAIRVGGSPDHEKWTYLRTRIAQKLARALPAAFRTAGIADVALNRASGALTRAARAIPAGLYIAHNLGALPSAVKAAAFHGTQAGFDAEDFHRHETSNDPQHPDVQLKTTIEDRYLPRVTHRTASSPAIARAYEELFWGAAFRVIRNVFPKTSPQKAGSTPPSSGQPLRLFWFSQTVGLNRGVQDVMGALRQMADVPAEFHVLGHLTEHVRAGLDEYVHDLHFDVPPVIVFHPPIAPDRLIDFAAQFDVGMATEPGFSINNDFALSNKLFTYLNAGLAIVASDTRAQADFIAAYPQVGGVYPKGDHHRLSELLMNYVHHPEQLTAARQSARSLADSELNWETEQKAFIRLVQEALL